MLRKASKVSLFESLDSSILTHWRWPDFQMEARDRFSIMFTKSNLRLSPKKVRKPAPPEEDSLKVLHYEKLKRFSMHVMSKRDTLIGT